MNLSEIRPKEVSCDIIHPGTGMKTGLSFQLVSLSDERMQTVRRKLADRLIAKRQRNKVITQAELDANRLELLFSGCTGWTWGLGEDGTQANWNGEELDFNQKNVMMLFKQFPQSADQLDAFIGEEENFFRE